MVVASVKLRDADTSKKEVNLLETGEPCVSVLAKRFHIIVSLDVCGNIFIEVPAFLVAFIDHLL